MPDKPKHDWQWYDRNLRATGYRDLANRMLGEFKPDIQQVTERDKMSVEQRQPEFYDSYPAAQEQARRLRLSGWTISVGMMRREDGRDYYVRAWRRQPP